MQDTVSSRGQRGFRSFVLGALTVGVVACVLAVTSSSPARSDESGRRVPPHFLSGSERSLVVLRDIKDVLERIDARLQRIESKMDRPDQAGNVAGNTHVIARESNRDGEHF